MISSTSGVSFHFFQNNFTESEINEEISENVKQDEPEITEEDIIENLNQLQNETFSQEPTNLDETSSISEEDEKKK